MKKYLILMAMLAALTTGCKKNKNDYHPPIPPPDDVRTILLKEIVVQSQPNPYFQFTYDSQNYVNGINFASGFFQYQVEYEDKRVKKMTNLPNKNTLVYTYANNQVSEINEFSGSTGNRVFRYELLYSNNHQLAKLTWFDFNTNADGHVFKKIEFFYHPDGNLSKVEYYFDLTGTQLTLERTDIFSDYDDKANVDDFQVLKDGFLDTYLFLPQVKLQKNNPRKQQILTPLNDYEAVYTYAYQDTLPVSRSGIMTQTRGANAGQSHQLQAWYHYY